MPFEVTRLPKDRVGFERVPNQATRNPDLSLAALGLLVRLLADGGVFDSIDALAEAYSGEPEGARRRGRGRDAYRAAARELEAAGHLLRTTVVINGIPANRLRVFADPYDVNIRSVPMTAEPSSVSPAETPQVGTSDATTAKPSSALTCENDAFPQVAPDDGSAVVIPIRPVLQTSDPPPPTPSPAGVGDGARLGGGGGSLNFAKEDDPFIQPARQLVDDLPYGPRLPSVSEHANLVWLVVSALADGFTVEQLRAHLCGNLATANHRVAVWAARLRPRNLPIRGLTVTSQDPSGMLMASGGHRGFQNPGAAAYSEPL